MTKNQLVEYIVENRQHSISGTLEYWLTSCGRFNDFAHSYRDKIRSKVRNATTDADLDDVWFELEIPYLFLLDERFEVEYEKRLLSGGRCPDYRVSFENSTVFNVEVGRIRGVHAAAPNGSSGPIPVPYTHKEFWKLRDAICEKLGQMVPGMINLLILSSASDTHEDVDLFWARNFINQLAAENDDAFFVKKGFEGTQDFLRQFKNLSGVLFRSTWISVDQTSDRNSLWCNDQADEPIPEAIKEYLSNDRESHLDQ